jgi:hypothetical protein
MFMIETEIKDARLRAFCRYVRETEPAEVFEEFMKEVEKLKPEDHANAKLGVMLETAECNAPGFEERKRRIDSDNRSILRRTNS